MKQNVREATIRNETSGLYWYHCQYPSSLVQYNIHATTLFHA